MIFNFSLYGRIPLLPLEKGAGGILRHPEIFSGITENYLVKSIVLQFWAYRFGSMNNPKCVVIRLADIAFHQRNISLNSAFYAELREIELQP